MRKLLSSLFLVSLASCVSATVEEPAICSSSSVGFQNAINIPRTGTNVSGSFTTSTAVDFSHDLHKFSDIGDLTITVNQLSFSTATGDFSWLHHVKVGMQPSDNQVDFPPLTLVDQDVQSPGNTFDLNVAASGSSIYDYLLEGQQTLTITLTGSFPDTSGATVNVCADVSDSVDKSL